MSFQDQILCCADCGKDFIFTAGEQEFYQNRGLSNAPKRCQDCRMKRKANQDNPTRTKRETQQFQANCSRCGALFNAPFKPKPDRPILCHSCFKK